MVDEASRTSGKFRYMYLLHASVSSCTKTLKLSFTVMSMTSAVLYCQERLGLGIWYHIMKTHSFSACRICVDLAPVKKLVSWLHLSGSCRNIKITITMWTNSYCLISDSTNREMYKGYAVMVAWLRLLVIGKLKWRSDVTYIHRKKFRVIQYLKRTWETTPSRHDDV